MRSALTSTAAGVVVMATGAVALMTILGASPSEPAVPDSAVATPAPLVAPAAPAASVTTTSAPEPIVVSVATPTPDLDGVGDAVARVLYGSGYAKHTAPGELEADLPPVVLELLIERQVTLTVATESTEHQELSP